MKPAVIELGTPLAVELRRQGFRPSLSAPASLWVRGHRHGRRFSAWLSPDGATLTVTLLGRGGHEPSVAIIAVDSPTFDVELLHTLRV